MGKKNKKKKEKVVYIDDGSSIVDMSGVEGARHHAFGSRPDKQNKKQTNNDSVYTGNKFKDSIRTYFKTVKLMIPLMFVTMGIISIAFFILWLLLKLALLIQ